MIIVIRRKLGILGNARIESLTHPRCQSAETKFEIRTIPREKNNKFKKCKNASGVKFQGWQSWMKIG
jgi:hypothetical protein